MSKLRTVRTAFSLALAQEFTYRTNFILGRLRDFLVFSSLLFVYASIPNGVRNYDRDALLIYTFASALLSAPLFVYGMHAMAEEIAEGDLANYLLKPIGYFWHWSGRLLAMRTLAFGGGIIQLALLLFLFHSRVPLLHIEVHAAVKTLLLLCGSILIVQGLDFCAALFSFWTPRGHGMRFLITIAITFLSGGYLPIDALPSALRSILFMTPFPSLVYAPVKTITLDPSWGETLRMMGIQWMWILVIYAILTYGWRKGLQRYAAYGN